MLLCLEYKRKQYLSECVDSTSGLWEIVLGTETAKEKGEKMTTRERQIAAAAAGARFAPVCEWHWSMPAIIAAQKIAPGTIAERSHQVAMRQGEPLLVAMDALLQYAAVQFSTRDGTLADDGVLGEPWLQAAKGIRALLNGYGAIATARNSSQDSKDDGAIEEVFWRAMELAGFTEADLA